MTSKWNDRIAEKRNDHSATAWIVVPNLSQPQDGAAVLDLQALDVQKPNAFRVKEADDAALTGSTRSLFRRLMGLNLKSRITSGRTTMATISPKAPLSLAKRVSA